jgi:uncharacterized membrane protein YbhN (UPF0104 family)
VKRWLLRAAVSAVVLAILLTFIPVGDVIAALRRVSPLTWLASVVIFFAGHYLNAIKLRLLAEGLGSTRMFVRAQYAGLVANLGLPGLAGGDLVRAAYLAPGIGLQRITVASIADRVIDTATILLLVVIALPFAGMPDVIERALRASLPWLVGGAMAGVVAFMVVTRMTKFAVLSARLTQAWRQVCERPSAVAGAVVITLAVQSAFVITNVWLARQVGVRAAVAAWFVAWPLAKLISIIPLSVGGIGVREAALVALLAPYGASEDAVFASGVLWQGVLLVTGLVGLAVTHLGTGTTGVAPVPPVAKV